MIKNNKNILLIFSSFFIFILIIIMLILTKTSDQNNSLWYLELEDLNNNKIILNNKYKNQNLLINFWATWCLPCIQEFPLLNEFSKNTKEIQIIAIALDKKSNVIKWLKNKENNFPVYILKSQGTEIMKNLGNEKSGLPFSVLFDKNGKIKQIFQGKISKNELNNLNKYLS